MDTTAAFWAAVLVVPPLAALLWRWNDYWYASPFRLRRHGGGAKLPPGHMGLPFVGEMPAFIWYFKIRRRPDDFINAKRRKYGEGIGMYRTYLLGSPTIIACTPSAAKFVLQAESSFGMGWNNVGLVGATSLVVVEGAAHTRLRALVLRAVNHPDALRRIALSVQPRMVAALQSWSRRGRITVLKEAQKYFAGIEAEHVLDNLDDLVKGIIKGFKSYPLNFPGTALHHALKCRRKATAIFREELEKRNKTPEATVPKNDLMEALMQMKDEEGNRLTDIEVLDNMVTLVIAGYTTTSAAIMWAFYYLAENPHVLQKLQEHHQLIGKKNVTFEEISSCKYTSQVVEEIIRLANVSAFVVRTATKDVDYRGYRIPKGWRVACWLRYLHTDPENFEDPLRFDPERWNVSNANSARAGSAFMVFGGGRRTCAGNMFARLQLALLLHHLVLRYRWKLVNPDAGITYLPHPSPSDEVEIDIAQI